MFKFIPPVNCRFGRRKHLVCSDPAFLLRFCCLSTAAPQRAPHLRRRSTEDRAPDRDARHAHEPLGHWPGASPLPPIALIIALIFLNYLAMTFGKQSRLRREALAKMEEVMATEHELLSLGGQAAAAAHSLGTPLSTIKIITQDLIKQFKGQVEIEKDIELLASQVERCNQILKRLTLNPVEEDEFIDKDLSMKDYISEIISSFKEISKKKFIFNFDQYSNSKKITKSLEIVYGLRNFIGNANKFSEKNVFINLKSDSETTEIVIEDDGFGFPRDILSNQILRAIAKLLKL